MLFYVINSSPSPTHGSGRVGKVVLLFQMEMLLARLLKKKREKKLLKSSSKLQHWNCGSRVHYVLVSV